MEGREGEEGRDAGGKVPINMEITSSSSPALHGSPVAGRKENGFSSYYSAWGGTLPGQMKSKAKINK